MKGGVKKMKTEMEYKITEKINEGVIKEIVEVEKQSGLTAENLLEKAKDKCSLLHNLFEWNNSKAGEKWRLHQARVLINEVKIIINEKVMYAFENVRVSINQPLNDKEEREFKREYKQVIEIFNNKEYRKQVVQSALESISYWKEKYSEYQELNPIFVSIEEVKLKWQKKNK
jgi:hypothetical protein